MNTRAVTLIGTGAFAVVAGVVWYLEPVFGGIRMDQLGIARAGAVLPSPVFLGLKLLLSMLGAYLMAQLFARFGVTGVAAGARFGAAVGLFSLTLWFDSAQAGQPLVLIVTDGLFVILVATAMGALLALARGREHGQEG